MKIDYSYHLKLENNQKEALEKALKNVCSNQGRGYDISVKYDFIAKTITISIAPKHTSHYVNFHVVDLKHIGVILNAEIKFCSLYEGKLELTYFK